MGKFQKVVLCKLCLLYAFTAFTFFLDLFSGKLLPCSNTKGEMTKGYNNSSLVPGSDSSFSQEGPWINGTLLNSFKCPEQDLIAYGKTMFMFGLLLGSILCGVISDRYGRRIVLLGSCIIQAVIGLMLSFLPNVIFYLIARLITGLTFCGINMSSFTLGIEWSEPKYRIWPPAVLSLAFSIGMMILAGVAFLTTNWWQLHLVTSAPLVLFLPVYYNIPESPGWLLSKKKHRELKEVLKKSAGSPDLYFRTLDCEPASNTKQKTNNECLPPFENFKSGNIIIRLCVMSYINFVSALIYYGISFKVGSFGVNLYLAQFFSGLVETPSILVPLLLVHFGRRCFSIMSLLLSGTAGLVSLMISKYVGKINFI
nr:PREDICTED: solute carrier family 22 member 1-like isoform X1 [Latimeria chalumnae]|eukprot:XP_006005360.1 PREDICTED: solute carrier family 22 member 1-like isoform X1 [Latimeria chalumnae]